MLNEAQINDITAKFNASQQSGNFSGYYQALANAGIYYGSLALGVVEDNTFFGMVANRFMMNKLVGDFDADNVLARRSALMTALATNDFEARRDGGWAELTGREISDYHDAAFGAVYSDVDGAPEAWTPYYIVRALDDYESWLPNSTLDLGSFLDYPRLHVPLNGSDPIKQNYAFQWFQDMEAYIVKVGLAGLEFVKGDNVLLESFAAYLGEENIYSVHKTLMDQQGSLPANERDASGFAGNLIQQALIDELFHNPTGENSKLSVSDEGGGVASLDLSYDLAKLNIDTKLEIDKALYYTTSGMDLAESERPTDAEIQNMSPFKVMSWGETSREALTTLSVMTGDTLTKSDISNEIIFAKDVHSNITIDGITSASLDQSGGLKSSVIVGNSGADVINVEGTGAIVLGGAGSDIITLDMHPVGQPFIVPPGNYYLDAGKGNDIVSLHDGSYYGITQLNYLFSAESGRDVVQNALHATNAAPGYPFVGDRYFSLADEILVDGLDTTDIGVRLATTGNTFTSRHDLGEGDWTELAGTEVYVEMFHIGGVASINFGTAYYGTETVYDAEEDTTETFNLSGLFYGDYVKTAWSNLGIAEAKYRINLNVVNSDGSVTEHDNFWDSSSLSYDQIVSLLADPSQVYTYEQALADHNAERETPRPGWSDDTPVGAIASAAASPPAQSGSSTSPTLLASSSSESDAGSELIVFSSDAPQSDSQDLIAYDLPAGIASDESTQVAEAEYITFSDLASMSDDDIFVNSSNALAGQWFEPEPIGAMV